MTKPRWINVTSRWKKRRCVWVSRKRIDITRILLLLVSRKITNNCENHHHIKRNLKLHQTERPSTIRMVPRVRNYLPPTTYRMNWMCRALHETQNRWRSNPRSRTELHNTEDVEENLHWNSNHRRTKEKKRKEKSPVVSIPQPLRVAGGKDLAKKPHRTAPHVQEMVFLDAGDVEYNNLLWWIQI